MVDGFAVYCYYLVFMWVSLWYIIVVTWLLVVCLIYTPLALELRLRALGIYIRQTTCARVTTIYCNILCLIVYIVH